MHKNYNFILKYCIFRKRADDVLKSATEVSKALEEAELAQVIIYN